ncbi:hypothetical protein [Flavobacterium sp.]|uniref:hypothetical protein n=1 Tax=Flavobacterium sp. TaxID=239 RepID=UPI003751BF7D
MKKALLTLVTILFLTGCSKDDENESNGLQLPQETQSGANTFGCFINGNLLLPRDGAGDISGDNKGLSFLGGYPDGAYNELDIRDLKSEHGARMLIHIQNLQLIGVGTYIIDESNGYSNIDGLNHNYINCKLFDMATNSYKYYRSSTNSGVLKITRFDWANGIISGTFTCQVKNSTNINDVIEITQGRFDINGYTLPNKIFL